MDFDHLPSNIFVEILRYLSVKEQVRIGRVNLRFRKISIIVVSHIKSIDSNDPQFCRLDSRSLSNLLYLCSKNLKRIKTDKNDVWLVTFAQFSYPNLIKLAVKTNRTMNNYFGLIVTKCPNLKKIIWFDDDEKKKWLSFLDCIREKIQSYFRGNADNDDPFRSFVGPLANLKDFFIRFQETIIESSGESVDHFLSTCPNLESFGMIGFNNIEYARLTHFWRLSSLRSLFVNLQTSYIFNDNDLEKITTSFPLLEDLCLGKVNATNKGIIALTTLTNLHSLGLYDIDGYLDLGIRRFIDCKNLQQLSIWVNITSITLITLVRNCHKLRQLSIEDIIDIETIEQAVNVIQAFDGDVKRNISISIFSIDGIWKSQEVKTALEDLKSKGHVIN